MGYMIATGRCISCGSLFQFNPDLVPSIRASRRQFDDVLIADPTAPKQPICQTCIERANPLRIKNGLPPIEVRPGAYDVAECT